MEEEKIIFCKSGGCTAKLGAGVLEHILEKLPKGEKDPNLLVGYDSKDDASVYRLTDNLAMVQTLDFFPPVVEDPYTFGKIAAANALSDIYAMAFLSERIPAFCHAGSDPDHGGVLLYGGHHGHGRAHHCGVLPHDADLHPQCGL